MGTESFCLFILFMGLSRQKYCSGLPFPYPVDHILSDLSTMSCPSWFARLAWLSFTELDRAVVHVIRLASCLWLWFRLSALWGPLSVSYNFGFSYCTLGSLQEYWSGLPFPSPVDHILSDFSTMTSDLKTHIDSKLEDGNIYSMQMEI